MQKFSGFIVKNRLIIGAIMLALMVLSVFSMGWVKVESNVMKYLPQNTEAKQGLDLMDREFITYATEDVMVRVADEEQSQAVYEMLDALPGTLMISFDTTSAHVKGGYALYNVTYAGADGSEEAIAAADELHEYLSGYEHYIYTSSLVNVSGDVAEEIVGVGIIVAIVFLAVMVVTSTTFAEIPVLVLTFAAAALLNMGTNFLLGTISMISNSVATIMQLALSIDYAVILCNRYKEEHQTKGIEEAVASALGQSVKEILSSSATTIAGLVSMTFMQFKLGRDMGFCLMKAIVMSLVSVFVVMPILLVLFGKLMDKTQHKRFLPRVDFLGKFAYASHRVVPIIMVVAAILACIIFGKAKYAYSIDLVDTIYSSQNQKDGNKIQALFGKNNMIALMVPSGDYEKEAALIEEIEQCDEVNRVLGLANIAVKDGLTLTSKIDYRQFMELTDTDEATAQALFAYYAADAGLYSGTSNEIKETKATVLDLFLLIEEVSEYDAFDLSDEQLQLIDSLKVQLGMAQDQLQGENYSRILVYVDLPIQGNDSYRFVDRLHVLASEYYDDAVITGNTVAARDFHDTFQSDSRTVSILSIGMVILILLFTFKSIAMPVLLILVIQGSIWINFAIPVIGDNYIYFMVYVIVSAIQMGANIDYAIVISSRYNDLRNSGLEREAAIVETMNLEFPTVITSGTIMSVAGLLIGTNVSDAAVSGIGLFLGRGTIITLIIANFALPQILIFSDDIVRKTLMRFKFLGKGRTAKKVLAGMLGAASLATVLMIPGTVSSINMLKSSAIPDYETLLMQAEELRQLARENAEMTDAYSAAKQDYAEAVATVNIGNEQLEEGKEELAAGKETLEEYKEKLANGEAQYAAGVQQYNEGLEQYESALATYNEGKAEYEAAAAKLAEGQAQYDAGAAKLAEGQAQYDAGAEKLASAKQQYNTAQAEMELVAPVYNTIFSAYSQYADAKARYDAAVAAGDTATASSLMLQVTLAETLWRSQESLTGTSMEQAAADYQASQAALADAAAQIADAEAQLADAKAQLEEGQAQLDASKAQLDEGNAQLADAKAQLDDGQKQLEEGKAKLDDAKKCWTAQEASLTAAQRRSMRANHS